MPIGCNEAIIGGQVDIALLGTSHYLAGVEKGADYHLASPISFTRTSIQTSDPEIKSILDIKPTSKIAISGYTSGAAQRLYIIAKTYFGDYHALDDNIVVMDQESAMTSLTSNGEITLHIGEPAHRVIANQNGCPTILEDAGSTCNLCVIRNYFRDTHKDLYDAYLMAQEEAIRLITEKDERALSILSEKTGVDVAYIARMLDEYSIKFSASLNDLDLDVILDAALNTNLISSPLKTEDLIPVG